MTTTATPAHATTDGVDGPIASSKWRLALRNLAVALVVLATAVLLTTLLLLPVAKAQTPFI